MLASVDLDGDGVVSQEAAFSNGMVFRRYGRVGSIRG